MQELPPLRRGEKDLPSLHLALVLLIAPLAIDVLHLHPLKHWCALAPLILHPLITLHILGCCVELLEPQTKDRL